MKNWIKKWALICSVCGGLLLFGCMEDMDDPNPPEMMIPASCGTDSALSTCITPEFAPEYYIDQGVKYFLTMQSDIPIDVIPNYSDLVIRWEWPPWLLLTGYNREVMILTDILLKLNPTTYDLIDCRFFEEQPFCRCHVIFNYGGELCPIYEEFTFNRDGEITFIEAWSDYESLLPPGMDAGEDGLWSEAEYWGVDDDVYRLANIVPGLGNAESRINLYADWMRNAARQNQDIDDLVKRCKRPMETWIYQLLTHYEELNGGCEPPEGDVYPYYVP
ncbi:MAG: hypothetical protein R2730_11775 [Chitinophagales bacterium]